MELTKETCRQTAEELLHFLEKSPSSFHAIANITNMLEEAGFEEIREEESWKLLPGSSYYVTRNQSSVIAFKVPGSDFTGFQIMASHSDSPSFKVKENPEMEAEGHFIKLNVEKYGGMIMSPWFDRPLSIAGRLVVEEDGRLVSRLVNVDRDLVMIPNPAIHMNRQVNDGYKYNAQKDTLPIFGSLEAKGSFMTLMAEAAGVKAEDILGHDLFLYSRDKGTIWGADESYLSCGRLDDLQCAFSSIKGLLAGGHPSCVSVAAVFDNEEVGSGTKQGADSTFLEDTLAEFLVLRATQDTAMLRLASCKGLSPSMVKLSRLFHSRNVLQRRGPTTPLMP